MNDTALIGRPWYELLVTDDELDALVHEERSRHPCRKAASTLVTTAMFLPPLIAAHHIFLVVTEHGFLVAPVAACFALTAVGLLELPLMYAANKLDPANTVIRARRDATARLSKLPLVIRYYLISSLETNSGRIHRYRALPIPPESQEDGVAEILDRVSLSIEIRDLPSKGVMRLRSKKMRIDGVEREDDGEYLVRVTVLRWEEAGYGE